MLVLFYAPELRTEVVSLEETAVDFRRGLFNFWGETHKTGKKPPAERYDELLVGPGNRTLGG